MAHPCLEGYLAYFSYSLNSVKGSYKVDYIGEYSKSYYGGYQEFRL